MEYYFDIETLGTDPAEKKIITIQWCPLRTVDGKATGDLSIMKEWESSEKDILSRFLDMFKPKVPWAFVPIGERLTFDLYFLRERWKRVLGVDIPSKTLYHDTPSVDIKAFLVMWNKGSFTGSGLDDLLGVEKENWKVPQWYEREEYPKIIDYIKREATNFLNTYQKLKDEIPKISLT